MSAKTFEKAVTGFNHNVKHRGQVYHVQTEDSGVGRPHILTHLFVGGNILASKKTSYADLVQAQNLPELVKALMEEQHKEMLRNLVGGVYDSYESAARAWQPGQLSVDGEQVTSPGSQPPPPEVLAARQLREQPAILEGGETLFGEDLISEKSLDQVILSFLGTVADP
ncbi:MAG: hypothetical protein FJ086_05815 [Deltaproteobacteria bacterium]|nr:hypothetical protein [Deltaproteobacteria bacterium]